MNGVERIILQALTQIDPGHEITYDYKVQPPDTFDWLETPAPVLDELLIDVAYPKTGEEIVMWTLDSNDKEVLKSDGSVGVVFKSTKKTCMVS